jgi:hypothetical protein
MDVQVVLIGANNSEQELVKEAIADLAANGPTTIVMTRP